MLSYLLIFLIGLIGAAVIFWRRFGQIRALTPEEVKSRLITSGSVRSELKKEFFDPAKNIYLHVYLPAFWRVSEKIVKRFRILIIKFETKLKNLSDNLRGRHINLEVSEKSPYWQKLDGAKQNGNGIGTKIVGGDNKENHIVKTEEKE